MIHHYLTVYKMDGDVYAEAWIQINAFGRCFCFSKRLKKVEMKYYE